MSTDVWNSGAPAGGVVTAQLLVAGASGARSILGQQTVTVGPDGRWQIALGHNSVLSFWEITEPTASGAPNQYPFQLPGDRGPIQVTQLKAYAAASTKPVVTGAKGGNAALTSVIAALVAQGLIVDQSS